MPELNNNELIYIFTNSKKTLFYVGQTTKGEERWREHIIKYAQTKTKSGVKDIIIQDGVKNLECYTVDFNNNIKIDNAYNEFKKSGWSLKKKENDNNNTNNNKNQLFLDFCEINFILQFYKEKGPRIEKDMEATQLLNKSIGSNGGLYIDLSNEMDTVRKVIGVNESVSDRKINLNTVEIISFVDMISNYSKVLTPQIYAVSRIIAIYIQNELRATNWESVLIEMLQKNGKNKREKFLIKTVTDKISEIYNSALNKLAKQKETAVYEKIFTEQNIKLNFGNLIRQFVVGVMEAMKTQTINSILKDRKIQEELAKKIAKLILWKNVKVKGGHFEASNEMKSLFTSSFEINANVYRNLKIDISKTNTNKFIKERMNWFFMFEDAVSLAVRNFPKSNLFIKRDLSKIKDDYIQSYFNVLDKERKIRYEITKYSTTFNQILKRYYKDICKAKYWNAMCEQIISAWWNGLNRRYLFTGESVIHLGPETTPVSRDYPSRFNETTDVTGPYSVRLLNNILRYQTKEDIQIY